MMAAGVLSDSNRIVTAASLESLDREREIKQKEAENLIADFVQRLKLKKKLLSQSFYFIHFNYFCHVSGKGYVPAEVALCEWSVEAGVKRKWHSFVNPGQDAIPTGYDSAIKEIREETHKIYYPLLKNNKPAAQMEEVFCEIMNFINVGRSKVPPPLFTYYSKENFHFSVENGIVVEDILGKMSEITGAKNEFRVFPIVKLFHELRNGVAYVYNKKGFATIAIAEMEMEKDEYQQKISLACQYHQERDAVAFCSLSYVQRWVFCILKHCSSDAGIPLVTGKHIPDSPQVFYPEEVNDQFYEPRSNRLGSRIPRYTWQKKMSADNRSKENCAELHRRDNVQYQQRSTSAISNKNSSMNCSVNQRLDKYRYGKDEGSYPIPSQVFVAASVDLTDEDLHWECPNDGWRSDDCLSNGTKIVKTTQITSTVVTHSVMKHLTIPSQRHQSSSSSSLSSSSGHSDNTLQNDYGTETESNETWPYPAVDRNKTVNSEKTQSVCPAINPMKSLVSYRDVAAQDHYPIVSRSQAIHPVINQNESSPVVKQHVSGFETVESMLKMKDRRIKELENKVKEMDMGIKIRDKNLRDLRQKIRELEISVETKDVIIKDNNIAINKLKGQNNSYLQEQQLTVDIIKEKDVKLRSLKKKLKVVVGNVNVVVGNVNALASDVEMIDLSDVMY